MKIMIIEPPYQLTGNSADLLEGVADRCSVVGKRGRPKSDRPEEMARLTVVIPQSLKTQLAQRSIEVSGRVRTVSQLMERILIEWLLADSLKGSK